MNPDDEDPPWKNVGRTYGWTQLAAIVGASIGILLIWLVQQFSN